ncbi:MAG TPA: redoxin family protein [Candidatus Dormibacteraeota bacterium]|nr:redoxin family protein [Candidatus Dormibacteraeota bacterium]
MRVRLALGAGLVLVAVLAIGLAWRGLSGGGAAGTLVVSVAARVPDHLSRAGLEVHAATGGWRRLGVVSGTVPAAPRFLTVYQGPAPAGAYDALRLGGDAESIDFRVVAGQVEPLLLAVSGGHLATAGVYAGNQAFSLGLNELSGQFLALPTFRLVDQDGHPFDNARIAGHELVLAPFLTACREACPIYAGLFLELRRELPSSVILAEVTVDPWDDTPAALRAYAQRVGVSWTLATGDPGALVDFWGRLGLQPTRGEMATGLLLVVDDHGFVRAREEGIPHLAASLPPSLADQLDAQGRQLLASGGDGWGAPQVVDAIQAIQRMATVSSPSEGEAPTFSLPARGGGTLGPQDFRGHPLVINFWASWCVPCRQELPLLQRASERHPGVRFLLVDERDGADAANRFLADLGVRLPVVYDSGQVGDAYAIAGLPTTVFVWPDGTIEGRYAGQLSAASLEAHLTDLEAARSGS